MAIYTALPEPSILDIIQCACPCVRVLVCVRVCACVRVHVLCMRRGAVVSTGAQ